MKRLILILILLFPLTTFGATVTKSICSTGADYSTITLWAADLDNTTPYDALDDAVGEMCDEAFDEEPTISLGGTIGLNTIHLTAATSARHTGTAGTGARILIGGTGGQNILSLTSAATTTVSWIEIDGNLQARSGAKIGISVAQASGSIIHHVIIHGVSSTVGNASGMNVSEDAVIFRTLLYRITVTAGNGDVDLARCLNMGASTKVQTVESVTCFDVTADSPTNANFAEGFNISDNANKRYQNILCLDMNGTGTGADICYSDTSITNATAVSNGASDTSASGTNPQDSLDPATELTSVTEGSEDLHLKTGATSIDAGVDLVNTPSGIKDDIDNYDVDAAGVTWDIGADEFVAAVGGAVVPDILRKLFVN